VHGMRSGYLVMDYTNENVRAIASHYAAEMIAMQPPVLFCSEATARAASSLARSRGDCASSAAPFHCSS
jgi:hypothetical protein